MNEPSENEKILGINKDKYLNLVYVLFLISAVYGVFTSILGLISITFPIILAAIVSIASLAALVMLVLGLFVFKDKLPSFDLSHLKYLGFIILILVVIGILVGATSGDAEKDIGMVYLLFTVVLNLFAFAVIYAGFIQYKKNIEPTKENVIKLLKSGFKS